MISVLLLLAYIYGLTFLYGTMTLRFFAGRLGGDAATPIASSLVHIVGLITLSVLAGGWAFFAGIGTALHVLLLAAGVAWSTLHRRELGARLAAYGRTIRRTGWAARLVFIVMLVLVVLTCVATDGMFDDGLYHLQTVRWLQAFGVVPGLGNLNSRLAFNSAWGMPSALFAIPVLGARSSHVLNGALTLWLTGLSLGNLPDLRRQRPALLSILAIGMPVVFLVIYYDQIGSLMTDPPATALIWIAFLCYLGIGRSETTQSQLLHTLIAVSIAAYAITVKLSALPVALLILVLLLSGRSRLSHAGRLWIIGVVAVIAVPWGITTVMLSGYLVYPAPWLDILRVDWKMPAARVLREQQEVLGWARRPGPDFLATLHEPLHVWVPPWFRQIELTCRVMLGLIALLSMSYLLKALAAPRRAWAICLCHDEYMLAIGSAALGVGFWFVTGPNPRFGYGFIYMLCSLLSAPVLRYALARRYLMARATLCIAMLFAAKAATINVAMNVSRDRTRLVTPAPYPRPATTTKSIDSTRIALPVQDTLCWDVQVPCTWELNPRLRRRGPQLRAGFRITE